MSRTGPVIIVEDDTDDQEMLSHVFSTLEIANTVKFFPSGEETIQYLLTTADQPFLILSDMNLPGMNGAELKMKINENEQLRRKAIPFVFLSTSAERSTVKEAYQNMVQVFFVKPDSLPALKEGIGMVINYWKHCKHPDSDFT